ncbi:MAG: hypothetical protein FJ117_22800 [Deltaproteobacteria bacterium]|nr:hypothetical protein [Deltaproteobacteria bacterium]
MAKRGNNAGKRKLYYQKKVIIMEKIVIIGASDHALEAYNVLNDLNYKNNIYLGLLQIVWVKMSLKTSYGPLFMRVL